MKFAALLLIIVMSLFACVQLQRTTANESVVPSREMDGKQFYTIGEIAFLPPIAAREFLRYVECFPTTRTERVETYDSANKRIWYSNRQVPGPMECRKLDPPRRETIPARAADFIIRKPCQGFARDRFNIECLYLLVAAGYPELQDRTAGKLSEASDFHAKSVRVLQAHRANQRLFDDPPKDAIEMAAPWTIKDFEFLKRLPLGVVSEIPSPTPERIHLLERLGNCGIDKPQVSRVHGCIAVSSFFLVPQWSSESNVNCLIVDDGRGPRTVPLGGATVTQLRVNILYAPFVWLFWAGDKR